MYVSWSIETRELKHVELLPLLLAVPVGIVVPSYDVEVGVGVYGLLDVDTDVKPLIAINYDVCDRVHTLTFPPRIATLVS